MDFFSSAVVNNRQKVVVIMGATGSGKSRLSVHIGKRFNGEIINSDKIQLYKGLDITTNKIPVEEQNCVVHHLLGDFDSGAGEITPVDFRALAGDTISSISSRGKIPIIAGGSNSFIYALLSEIFDPESDVFSGSDRSSFELRYECCFLWIDVSLPVLNEYLGKRVDEMLDSGMVNELADFHDSELVNDSDLNSGIRKAIGVSEFENYFRLGGDGDDQVRQVVYEQAVMAIKDNTCQLAKKQVEKIMRLKTGGWNLHRLDGTDSFRAVIEGSTGWSDIWERQVVSPSVKLVKRFLDE